MLGFSYKTVLSAGIAFLLLISTALLKLLPDIFDPKDFIVYQVWLLGIWIFIMILPRKTGTILDIPIVSPISKK
tara:strand:+ start:563 stop:784 length:222 start_codon:yes stop_codon:yes gene_type:complete